MNEENGAEPIAVIGLTCRVPGAADVSTFWQSLLAGERPRTELSRERMLAAGATEEQVDDPDYVPVGYLLDDVENFDAAFFGMSPREAALADPQHRLFLELCHSALENAGWDPARFPGDIAVYGGRGSELYRWRNIEANRAIREVTGFTTIGNGNHPDTFTTMASYRLNLRGPSVGVYAACSTSLVAVHMAAEALRARETDMALAGGVSIELPADQGYLYQEGGIVAADGICRPFDAAATGTVASSGGGAVLLKRLSDAQEDGDHIYAVILGNAINNDGASKVGFTSPSVPGQVSVIANALAVADVDPRSISYVEAHGTATALGDPIEMEALTAVYGRHQQDRQWCAVGSVKSNVGHLSQGAGVVSLIKTVLAIQRGLIPASIGYTAPNPAIDFAASPFYVNGTLSTWDTRGGPRRAAVSSFGIGGTNAHVVLGEAPPAGPSSYASAHAQLLTVSARTAEALGQALARLADHLAQPGAPDLGDVAYTLRAGRVAHQHRAAVVGTEPIEASTALRAAKRVISGAPTPVAFLFSGQGSQYAGMAASLYAHEPVFAAAIDECGGLVERDLSRTEFAQPALFAVGYALAKLWQSWGVTPTTMIGHSVGEYVAATLAGVFDLPDALRLISLRGRLMQGLPAGSMLAVAARAESLELPEGLSLAAVNGPQACVVSGPTDLVEAFAKAHEGRSRMLRTSHAFHSAMMDPILAEFTAAVAQARPKAPRREFLSNLTGLPVTAAQAADPEYWAAQMRGTVRFGDCVAHVLSTPTLLLECGPGRQLAGLAQTQVPKGSPAPVHSLPGPNESNDDLSTIYAAAGRLWTHGIELDPAACGGIRRRVPLPGYPYERRRHWIDPDRVDHNTAPTLQTGTRERLDDWFSVPSWRRLPPMSPAQGALPSLVTIDAGDDLVGRLREFGAGVVAVTSGDTYAKTGPARYTIRVDEPGDYAALVRDLGAGPRRWIHAHPSMFSLLHLVQAVSSSAYPVEVDVLTRGACQVLGGDLTDPDQALLTGVIRSAPLDVAGLHLRHIDAPAAEPSAAGVTSAGESAQGMLLAELLGEHAAGTFALRGRHRWAPTFERTRLPEPADPTAGLRRDGVYLITGGGGALGQAIAADLVQRVGARVVLLSRTGTPVPGAHVLRADVTDVAALRAARAEIFERHGRLDGIVHAAGVAGGGLTEQRTRADMEPILAPKVAGTKALREVFGDLELDFVALFSSIVGTVGGLGEVDYCAANAFLDAHAQSDHGWRARTVRSLAWAGWQGAGMMAAAGVQQFDNDPGWYRMTPAEGVAAFHRAICADLGGLVVISPQSVEDARTRAGTMFAAASAAATPVALPAASIVEMSTVESGLAGIWSSLLGSEGIAADDDFFALGGTSLLAVQLIAQVRKAFGVRLPVRIIFDASTLAGMAAEIGSRQKVG